MNYITCSENAVADLADLICPASGIMLTEHRNLVYAQIQKEVRQPVGLFGSHGGNGRLLYGQVTTVILDCRVTGEKWLAQKTRTQTHTEMLYKQ